MVFFEVAVNALPMTPLYLPEFLDGPILSTMSGRAGPTVFPRIELAQGDITRESTDAIVNAANTGLRGGGGVDGAIHRAGGPAILEECRRIGGCPTGEAVITTGGNLRARYVIHTVGPIYRDGRHGEPDLLAGAYRSSMKLAKQHHLSSIAFPSISTGVYGYPVEEAAPVALRVVLDELEQPETITLVRFVLFDERTYAAYQAAWESLRA
jgi:O-acetyl-ADP-ribose deacetylase (regulator of RNase III)